MRLIKNLCKYCTKYCTTINVNDKYMFQNTMTTQVCCTCNTQECETKSNENNLQLRYLVDKHQKGYKYCSCPHCVNISKSSVENGDRKFCCGCYIHNVIKCPLFYSNSHIYSNAWSFELKDRIVHRKTIATSLPEYFFRAFFESTKKGYCVFNDKKHINDVIEWINTLYGIEYTHNTVSINSIVNIVPLTIYEFMHARNVWYKSQK